MRVGTHVLNIDFRPAALLARASASLDIVSNGRFELGLGTGYMDTEYKAAGLSFDRPVKRIRRVEQTIDILRGLFAGNEVTYEGSERTTAAHTLDPLPTQGTAPPILVGGNGDRILEVAATKADVVGFTGFGFDAAAGGPQLTHMTSAGLANRLGHVRSCLTAAGNSRHRSQPPEYQTLIQQVIVTDDPETEATAVAQGMAIGEPEAATIFDSPFVLVGTVDSICDELQNRRDTLGISYLTFFAGRSSPEADEIVGRLAGT